MAKQSDSNSIHLIGSAHLDPVWLWPWTDGYSEVKASFQSALDRLDEYPGFIFTCAGACYYQWIEESDPAMFAKIKQAIKDGRWVPVGGWYIQPDCNIPAGESFARHSLYSQRYYLEKFEFLCETGYNVDSFGHSGMLPQILQLSGLKHYVFSRPSDLEKPGLDNIFNWQSKDGSSVLAFKIPSSYIHSQPDSLPEKISQVRKIGQALDQPMMLFYGVGNHGGGPTIALLDRLEQLKKADTALCYSSPPAYMAAISERKDCLQLLEDDLQHHAIGCYSALLAVKQQNRQAENQLLAAEAFDTVVAAQSASPAASKRLALAWEKVMFNQFHDILTGCSLKEAYHDAAHAYGYARHEAAQIKNLALQKISWSIDTMGDQRLARSKEADWKLWGNEVQGTPLVIFNPLPFAVTAPVQAAGDLRAVTSKDDPAGPDLAAISDDTGNYLSTQQVRGLVTNGSTGKWNTLFLAELPALGYKTFWLHKIKPADARPAAQPGRLFVAADGSRIENDFIALELDAAAGGLTSLFDKINQRELLAGPASLGLVIDESHSDTWGHGLSHYADVCGKFTGGSLEVLEDGPLRAVVRLTSSWHGSSLTQDIQLYHDRPEIELALDIFWQEKHKQLKMEYPLAINEAIATSAIPYGFIERPQDGKEQPIQQWIDLSNEKYGVAILNDSTYAAAVENSTIRLTVLRGAAYADHYGERDDRMEYMDQGQSKVKFIIYPHQGSWQSSATVQKAMALNQAPSLIYETYHNGRRPRQDSWLKISPANIIMTALKSAEDDKGYILRCYESSGTDCQANLDLPFLSRSWQADFSACQIKTFYIPKDRTKPVKEVNLLELPLAD